MFEDGPSESTGRPHQAAGNGRRRGMVALCVAASRGSDGKTEPGLQADSSAALAWGVGAPAAQELIIGRMGFYSSVAPILPMINMRGARATLLIVTASASEA